MPAKTIYTTTHTSTNVNAKLHDNQRVGNSGRNHKGVATLTDDTAGAIIDLLETAITTALQQTDNNASKIGSILATDPHFYDAIEILVAGHFLAAEAFKGGDGPATRLDMANRLMTYMLEGVVNVADEHGAEGLDALAQATIAGKQVETEIKQSMEIQIPGSAFEAGKGM